MVIHFHKLLLAVGGVVIGLDVSSPVIGERGQRGDF